MTQFDLRRTKITGDIHDDTPLCVIVEIAGSLSLQTQRNTGEAAILPNHIIASIMGTSSRVIEEDDYDHETQIHGFRKEDLPYICCFVNPNRLLQWKIKPLIAAFRHIMTYYNAESPALPNGDFVIGNKSGETPQAYDASMLYRLCTYHGIRTDRNTTMEKMGYAVRGLSIDPQVLREQMIATIMLLPRCALINVSMAPEMRVSPPPNIQCPCATEVPVTVKVPRTDAPIPAKGVLTIPNINPSTVTSASFGVAYNRLTNLQSVMVRIVPLSHTEATVMAAVVFGINLTECCNPYEEYCAMKNVSLNSTTDNSYVPVHDDTFRRRYIINPEWFDVRRTWTPRLPCIYTPDHLRRFVMAEGYEESRIRSQSMEEIMHLSTVTPTFYLGIHPDSTVTTTAVYLDDIATVNPKLLITYGILNECSFVVYNVSELADCFLNAKSFCNPSNVTEQISEVAIQKLRNIAQEQLNACISKRLPITLVRPSARGYAPLIPPAVDIVRTVDHSETTEVGVAYHRLLDAIKAVDQYYVENSKYARALADRYKTGDSELKAKIHEFLTTLLHVSYYMRGWKVGNNHNPPIKRDDTGFTEDLQGQVYLNSTNAIAEFEAALLKLPTDVRTLCRSLPLMRPTHRDGHTTFIPTENREQGITIIDRLGIVKGGKSDYSCIRLSSNFFAGSAYYYMRSCGFDAPFTIGDLSTIS